MSTTTRSLQDVALSHHSLGELDLPSRLAAASAAGFTGVGLSIRRTLAWLDGRDPRVLLDLLAVHEVVAAELEVLTPLADRPDPLQQQALELAGLLGGPRLQVIAPNGPAAAPGPALDSARLDRLRDLVARADQVGSIVMLEFLPFSTVPSLAAALDVVAAVDGLTVCVDAWHLHRSGGSVDSVVDAAEVVGALQLCDGPLVADLPLDLEQDCRTRRRLPGQGEFDLAGLLAAVPRAPLCVEIAATDLHALDPRRAARLVADATTALLRQEEPR